MIDGNGNIIPVNAIRGEKGKDGVNGKSAYEQAKEGGYDGTEQEFIATLNGLTAGEHAEHYANLDNPHQVTAQQVGALPITGGQLQGGLGLVGEGDANTSEIVQNSDFATIFRNKAGGIETILSLTNESKVDVADVLKLWFANGNGYSIYGEHNKPTASEVGAIPETYYVSGNLDNEMRQGGGKMVVCCYTENTQNTPHKEGLTDCTHGMVITNAFNSQYATQLSIPSGEDAIYVRRLNGSGVSKWVKMADNERVTPIEKGGTGATTAKVALENLGALPLSGGKMTGHITLSADPTEDMHPASKKYVDNLKGAKFTLLWENASPSSSFANQTLTITGITNYDYLVIDIVSESGWRHATAMVPATISRNNSSGIDYSTVSMTYVKETNWCTLYRMCRVVDANSIYFQEGYRMTLSNKNGLSMDYGSNSSSCVPIKIYGVKL